jgi:hypothetical protein
MSKTTTWQEGLTDRNAQLTKQAEIEMAAAQDTEWKRIYKNLLTRKAEAQAQWDVAHKAIDAHLGTSPDDLVIPKTLTDPSPGHLVTYTRGTSQ